MANGGPRHLRDLFRTGYEGTVYVPDPDTGEILEIKIWFRKPDPGLTQEAAQKSQAKQARTRIKLKDKESDEYMALAASWMVEDDPERLKETLLLLEDSKLRDQAQQDVLHGDFGSNWGQVEKNGIEPLDWLGSVSTLFARREEIRVHNLDYEPSDERWIKPEEDPDLLRLQAIYDQYNNEVDERLAELRQQASKEFDGLTVQAMQEKLEKRGMEMEARVSFMAEYQLQMLYHACREVDNHSKYYFKSPAEITELPDSVQTQLYERYQELEFTNSDLKTLPTPASSSPSSEQ